MYDISAQTIGKNIGRMLAESGKTQAELAEHCGVHKSTPSSWIGGKKAPRADKMAKICDFFGCSISELLGDAEGSYYLMQDAEELAQFLYNNPDYHVLFDAVRTVKKEDVEFVKDFIDRLKR